MGHATHFLSRLERLSTTEVELALGLYRDVPLLKEVLSRSSLPDGADRAAISLKSEDGPWLVVGRDGGFVTCLGQGMTTGDLPIVSHARLQSVSSQVERLRQRLDAASRLGSDLDQGRRLFSRLFSAGPTLTGSEMSTLEEIAPLMQPQFQTLFLDLLRGHYARKNPLSRSERHHRRQDDDLVAYRRDAWTIGHLSPLLLPTFRQNVARPDVDDEVMLMVPLQTWATGLWATAARGLWAASMLGKPLVSVLKQKLRSDAWVHFVPAVTALIAIGVRHSKLTAEIRKVFDRDPASIAIEELHGDGAPGSDIFSFARTVLDHPGGTRPFLESVWSSQVATLFPGSATPPSSDDVWSHAFGLVHPLFNRPATLRLIATAGWVGRASLEELYPSPAQAERIHVREEPEEIWESLIGWRGDPDASGVRRPDTPGRNEPCACGSGRKFKRCCGG